MMVVEDIWLEMKRNEKGCIERGEWKGRYEVSDILEFLVEWSSKVGRALVYEVILRTREKNSEWFWIDFYDRRIDTIEKCVGSLSFIVEGGKVYVTRAEYRRVVC